MEQLLLRLVLHLNTAPKDRLHVPNAQQDSTVPTPQQSPNALIALTAPLVQHLRLPAKIITNAPVPQKLHVHLEHIVQILTLLTPAFLVLLAQNVLIKAVQGLLAVKMGNGAHLAQQLAYPALRGNHVVIRLSHQSSVLKAKRVIQIRLVALIARLLDRSVLIRVTQPLIKHAMLDNILTHWQLFVFHVRQVLKNFF